jgi:hypothetical protein
LSIKAQRYSKEFESFISAVKMRRIRPARRADEPLPAPAVSRCAGGQLVSHRA